MTYAEIKTAPLRKVKQQRKKVARNAVPSGGGNGKPLSLAEDYKQAFSALFSDTHYIDYSGDCQYPFLKNKFRLLTTFFV